MYRSEAGGKTVEGVRLPVTVSKLTGKRHDQGDRITTMDALQAAFRYCKPRGFHPKETIDCKTPDGAGVIRKVFLNRLCDGYIDCPNGEDENGDMAKCKPAHPPTANGCCGSIILTNQGNMDSNEPGKRIECIATGVGTNGTDLYECDYIHNGHNTCIKRRLSTEFGDGWGWGYCDGEGEKVFFTNFTIFFFNF